jgi:hypothetical protein
MLRVSVGSVARVVGSVAALLLLLPACSGSPAPVFIALDRDFAPFRTWEQVDFGDDSIPGHPQGQSYGYISHRTKNRSYPVGTMIVKAFVPSWALFAMAKRGGNFNPEGALDWEFFRLELVNDTPVIVSRGIFAYDPNDDGGVGYNAAGNVLNSLCNGCHGTPASAATDHVLSPQLRPGS